MFAVWITGLPASGKSTLASALVEALRARGLDPAVLESDVFRRQFASQSTYSEEERERFYGAMVWVGELLVTHGVPVIFDATANRRAYRDRARERIARFLEVYVECPIEVCIARDPKGIYRKAREGAATTVPGVQVPYEPPERPEVHVRGDRGDVRAAARKVLAALEERGWLGDSGAPRG